MNIMDLSVTVLVLTWARQSNFSGRASLGKADGWNLKRRRHQTVARHLREKTHPRMLVVTLREGEKRGICSAALKQLVNITKDQVAEGSVVILVLNKESAIWQESTKNIVCWKD